MVNTLNQSLFRFNVMCFYGYLKKKCLLGMNISIFASNFSEKMKRILVLFLGLFFINSAFAQINEIGVFVGGSNFVGDVGKETFIDPNSLALGGLYKWNRSTRHAWRFSVMHSTLKIDDAKSNSSSRPERGLNIESTVTEFAAGLEFNFFEFDLHNLGTKITPYVHTGVGYFWYNTSYYIEDTKENKKKNGSSLAIPMVLGIKFNLTQNFVLGIESAARYTLTDDIDANVPEEFGNLESNDWYMFTGFTLTYTFGRNPCFCPL